MVYNRFEIRIKILGLKFVLRHGMPLSFGWRTLLIERTVWSGIVTKKKRYQVKTVNHI